MAADVTADRFDLDVIERSKSVPVLVDFWAEWCGPCRMLGPVLHRMEEDYAGRFALAKVNTDHSPGIASTYRVSGIPAVKLFRDGAVVDEFVGAFPEAEVRRFLDKNLPDPRLVELRQSAESSPTAAADAVLADQLSGKEASEILWQGVLHSLRTGGQAALRARAFLEGIPEFTDARSDARTAVLALLDRDFGPERQALLRSLLGPDVRPSLESMLAGFAQSSGSERDNRRADLVAAFHLLGNHGELVDEFRRKLASALH